MSNRAIDMHDMNFIISDSLRVEFINGDLDQTFSDCLRKLDDEVNNLKRRRDLSKLIFYGCSAGAVMLVWFTRK
jgi:predicted esterase